MISSPILSGQWTSLALERPGVAAAGGVRSEMCRGGRWVETPVLSPRHHVTQVTCRDMS